MPNILYAYKIFFFRCIILYEVIKILDSLQRRVAMIVDEMGKASARAQELKMPITTAEKLSKSDHSVYLLSEKTDEEYVPCI